MHRKTLALASATISLFSLGYYAGEALGADAGEHVGPLHLSESSAPDADGYRQKVWAMAPGLTGGRTYVYRNPDGSIVDRLSDFDNGTTNDEFDIFCPGADGATPAKTLAPSEYGAGTLELIQDGETVYVMPVNMCGPNNGTPIVPTPVAPVVRIQPAPVAVPLNLNTGSTPPQAPVQPRAIITTPKLSIAKSCKRKTARAATCKIKIKNTGNLIARRVVVVDRLPAGTYFIAKPKRAKIIGRARAARWTVSVKAGTTKTLTVRMGYKGFRKARKCNVATARLGNFIRAKGKARCVTFPARQVKITRVPVTG